MSSVASENHAVETVAQISLMAALVEHAMTMPGVTNAGIETIRDRKTFWIETRGDTPECLVHKFTATTEE